MTFRMDFMKKRYMYLDRTIKGLMQERSILLNQIESIDYRLSRLEPQMWETLEAIVDERCSGKDGKIVE